MAIQEVKDLKAELLQRFKSFEARLATLERPKLTNDPPSAATRSSAAAAGQSGTSTSPTKDKETT